MRSSSPGARPGYACRKPSHMPRYSNDPREIRVKYAAVCAETGRALKPGDPAIYYPASRALYHPESQQAYQFRNWQADLAMGQNY